MSNIFTSHCGQVRANDKHFTILANESEGGVYLSNTNFGYTVESQTLA